MATVTNVAGTTGSQLRAAVAMFAGRDADELQRDGRSVVVAGKGCDNRGYVTGEFMTSPNGSWNTPVSPPVSLRTIWVKVALRRWFWQQSESDARLRSRSASLDSHGVIGPQRCGGGFLARAA